MTEHRMLKRKDVRKAVRLPSSKDLDHLEGLDWTRVNLNKQTCSDGEKDFNTNAEMHTHMPCADRKSLVPECNTQGSRKRYKCHICGYEAVGVWKLHVHLSYHYEERTWKCNHCDIRPFLNRNELFDHLRFQHYSRRCLVKGCTKIFTSQPQLMRHSVKAHGRELGECKSCRKLFLELASHVKQCKSNQ